MLSAEDEKFIVWWQEYRANKAKMFRQFVVGAAIGLAIGAAVIISVLSGWYKRATMIANTGFDASTVLIAILIITLFIAFFYKKYKWEMNEQHYLELLAKKKKLEKNNEAAKLPPKES